MKSVNVGVIGCGNISAAYLKAAKAFRILDVVALSDANPEAAQARSAEFGIPARPVDDVLADPAVEVILNLTVPKAHVEVGLRAIAAGKHVHSEKPLGVTVAEARTLVEAAKAQGLRLGCAPDTFLGGAHQTARQSVDDGLIGRPVGGTAFFMCPGHERWHPNPGFYYLAGGGPMLDMGPYYVTDLVNLLGPVASVIGVATRTRSERLVTSEPLKGAAHPRRSRNPRDRRAFFVSGAAASIAMSFDVPRHRHVPIELYGEAGSLIVPDPNFFGGTDRSRDRGRGLARGPDPSPVRRRQLSDPRSRGHGASDPHGQTAPRKRRPCVSCPRGDGGVPEVLGLGRGDRHREPPKYCDGAGCRRQ